VENEVGLSFRLTGAWGMIQIPVIRYMRNHRHEDKIICPSKAQGIEHQLRIMEVQKLQCKQ
jgi:hypothetical protein